MKKRRIERDNLRERERQARAQMSSLGSELQEAVPMFRPPVKVDPAATDRETQQIQSRLGDFHSIKLFLDDPKSSIGVYGEPASPAPGFCNPSRSIEFKRPHHASPQNGRPHHRMPNFGTKYPEGLTLTMPPKAQPYKMYNGKTPTVFTDPNGTPNVENILKEMKLLPGTPLSDIASTPRKESEFPFNGLTLQKINENASQTELIKPIIPPKNHLDRHTNPRLSADLERDLRLSDSEDEARKRMPNLATQTAGASSSGSDSEQSDSDSDSSSDDSKHNGTHTSPSSPVHDIDEPAEVVEGPGETPTPTPTQQRSSWGLSNFAPQRTGGPSLSRCSPNGRPSPIRSDKLSPRRSSPIGNKSSPRVLSPQVNRFLRNSPHNRLIRNKLNISSTAPGSNTSTSSNTSTNNAESDSCYDSTKEVEEVLAEAKGKTEVPLLSGLSDSENETPAPVRPGILGSNSERSSVSRGGGRLGARRSPRTPARPRLPSSPSASEDEAPSRPRRPDPERPRGRGRPRKTRTEEDAVKRRRGRPPKQKLNPPPRPSSSDDDHPPSSPTVPSPHYQSGNEVEKSNTVDKKKIDTLRKLFCVNYGGAKGGGKGGGKGGKGKGQVMIIEACTIEDDKEDEMHQRSSEEEASRIKEEEIAQKKLQEEAFQRQKDDEYKRHLEELHQNKLRKELQRKKDEAAAAALQLQKKIREEAANQRRLKEEEEETLKRQEEMQNQLREKEMLQKRQEEEAAHRKEEQRRLREEEHRRYKEEDLHQRYKENITQRMKDEDVLQTRLREDEAAERRSKIELPDIVGSHNHTIDGPRLMVHIDLRRLSIKCANHLAQLARPLKRPPPTPPAPPDKRPKISRQNPETTPTNHERVECVGHSRNINQPLVYYSYLEKCHQDCSSDDESRDHKHYLTEALQLRKYAERESDPLGRVMLYQESVLCFVLTGRVLELELDTKKAFTLYRETLEYMKYIHSMPGRTRASPFSTLTKLDVLSYRCQALLCLRMFKMYKREVKEYNKILQDYQQKQSQCLEPVGTVSPLSPTPSPAGSVGSVGSAGSGSSGYGSGAPAATPQHTPSSTPAPPVGVMAMPAAVQNAQGFLVKYYTFLHKSHDLWDLADSLIRDNLCKDFFITVDRVCGPLTLHSSFRHLVKYVRYAITQLKSQSRHNT